jgi:hypothetical protein
LNPSVLGDPITFTATPSEFDAGTVITFSDGELLLGTCTIQTISCSIIRNNMSIGVHTITAKIAESTHYKLATSSGVNQQVGSIPTTTTWSVSAWPKQGETITLSTVVSPSAVSGVVEFKDSNGNTLCTTSELVSGSGSCVWSGYPVAGLYNVYANYVGDLDYAQSVGVAANIEIKVKQSVLSWNLPITSIPFQGSLTLAVSGGSGDGAVSYSVSVESTCSVVGLVLTPGNAGSLCEVTANKAADDYYSASSTSSQTITVTKNDQADTLAFTNSNSLLFGRTLPLSVTGGSGPGYVSYRVTSAGTSGCVITSGFLSVTAAGSCSISASRAGSTNYNETVEGNEATLTVSVTTAPQEITVNSTSSSLAYGETSTLSASGYVGTGRVTFVVDSGDCSIVGHTLMATSGSGSCYVYAEILAGDDYSFAQSESIEITLSKAIQNELLWNLTETSVAFQSTLALDVLGGTGVSAVSYEVSAESTCVVEGSILTPGEAGSTCEVMATKAADDFYATTSTDSQIITVTKINQENTLRFVTSDSVLNEQEMLLEVEGGSGDGEITFSITEANGTECEIVDSTLRVNASGNCEISATRGESTNYNATVPGAEAALSVTVYKNSTTTPTPTPSSSETKQSASPTPSQTPEVTSSPTDGPSPSATRSVDEKASSGFDVNNWLWWLLIVIFIAALLLILRVRQLAKK